LTIINQNIKIAFVEMFISKSGLAYHSAVFVEI